MEAIQIRLQKPSLNRDNGFELANICDTRWVHTNVVSRPQVHLSLTSDQNGFNFNSSSLLCGHGNAFTSKEPKYTLKSSSDHPYEPTYVLSKQIPETDVNQTRLRVLFLWVYSYKVTYISIQMFLGWLWNVPAHKIKLWTWY